MTKAEVLRKAIVAECERRRATAAQDLVETRLSYQDPQELLDDLLFFTSPKQFLSALDIVEHELPRRFGVATEATQERQLSLVVELALALRSFLPRWNLQNVDRHGVNALTDGQVTQAADRMHALAVRLSKQSPSVTSRLLERWRVETARRLEAEAAPDPQASAQELVGGSVDSYLSNISAQLAHSNLRRIAEMYLAKETRTEIGNDFAAFLPYARYVGACFVTCNPPLVERAWASDPERWTPVVDHIILNHPQADTDRLALLTTAEVVLAQMRLLRPLFLLSEGKTGYVCLQVNPHKHDDAAAMIADALFIYEWLQNSVSGVPNVVFKLPGTRAGLEACRWLTSKGIGVTITVNFGLFQHIRFAEAIRSGEALVSYLVEMNGRLAFPVRDELLARLDTLAAHGIDENRAREAAAWAGVALVKRVENLLARKGFDRERVKTLVASLRIYQGDSYRDLPSPFPDITETIGAGVISVFPNIRRPFDAHAGLTFDPRRIESPVPSHIMDVLAHSEIFKQAYFVADRAWATAEDEQFRPAQVLQLEDEAKVAAWSPVYNTLTEFIKSYDVMVERILERKQLLAA